jgi:hypothetical protein
MSNFTEIQQAALEPPIQEDDTSLELSGWVVWDGADEISVTYRTPKFNLPSIYNSKKMIHVINWSFERLHGQETGMFTMDAWHVYPKYSNAAWAVDVIADDLFPDQVYEHLLKLEEQGFPRGGNAN